VVATGFTAHVGEEGKTVLYGARMREGSEGESERERERDTKTTKIDR
jgi:hypothetical protein